MDERRATATIGDDINNEDRVRVLGIIDQFRELGVNEDVSLPQLVVVGDQSSGKSSVLEGVTGLSFPIASELCTRFATQIILKRSVDVEEEVKASIIPGPTACTDPDRKSHIEGFAYTLKVDDIDAAHFEELLDKAADHMGLPTSTTKDLETLSKRFSDDVLRIEISSPSNHHLSVVDVPGLFHNPTKYQTEEDLEIIRDLLKRYITDSRTIILAVMDARNNLANQEVFRMARAADPQGRRTVGIITKCDALQQGDESMVLRIAQNLVESLTHGWFVVKNRSTQDILEGVTIEQRHKNEQHFFSKAPWTSLSKGRIGIHNLKKFLGRLLYDHIRGEFPALVEEIRSMASEERVTLEGLGPARQTTQQQRHYLSRLAAQHQGLVSNCLSGNYDGTWTSQDHRKIRMRLQLANQTFAEDLATNGHYLPFRTINNGVDKEYVRIEREEMHMYDWIRSAYRDSRGSELPGTVNPAVLERLFRQQASGWRKISERHLTIVNKLVAEFNAAVFVHVFTDDNTRTKMEQHNQVKMIQCRKAASEQLQDLLAVELNGILQTVNHYFAETLDKTRKDRVLARFGILNLAGNENVKISASSVRDMAFVSNEDQAVYDIHDILKAYYKLARKRFADAVVTQVIEKFYVGADGPLKYVSPEQIGSLSDEQLNSFAGENYATSSRRNEIVAKLDRLERALALAEQARL